jgi:glycosyltransferase involved in cell wall biosynthesis
MELRADQITIAITVYNRRDYVRAAVRSALEQTVPVKVIVVDNCSPDEQLQDYVLAEFGGRVDYFRNSRNRGMFDNWNACMEYCRTPWLSILHDDDLLRPGFVETMIQFSALAPGRGLYFGRSALLNDATQKIQPPPPVSWAGTWRELDLLELSEECFLVFPGQLFSVAAARTVGGFRPHSYFTGDWDMWFRLALHFGGAQVAAEVAVSRTHYNLNRGSTRVERMGWKWALDNAQRKRNLFFLAREKGLHIPFDRPKLLKASPIPSRSLLMFAPLFSQRILAYNTWLFTHSRAPNWGYAVLQWLARFFGPRTFLVLAILSKRPG